MKALITAVSTTSACLLALGLASAFTPSAVAATPERVPVADGGIEKTQAAPVRRASSSTVQISPSRISHGGMISLRGKADTRSSAVRIDFRPSGGSRWYTIERVATDRRGRYSAVVPARGSGQFRAVVPGGRSSRPRNVLVRSRLSVSKLRKYAKIGSRMMIRGSVSPAGRRLVKVVIRGAESDVLYARTRAHGGFKLSWKPDRSGSYRVRVFAAANERAIADSSRQIRVNGLRPTHASYFGPGLFGGALACGGTLQTDTRGVAHKSLPCGTKVTLRYRGRTVTTRVVDRGPFIAGREFDLTQATRNDLGFGDIGVVWTNR